MRLAGTSIVCVLAAFGAAFLVARASGQGTPHAARTPARAAASGADAVSRPARKVDVELASQFAPQLTALVRPARSHRRASHKLGS